MPGGRGHWLARTPLRDADPAQVGSYRLTARLGAGGMGVVYLATAGDGSPVAVKVLRPELSGDAEFRTRFSREVAALTRVKPTEIAFSGDATNVVTGITWSSWTATGATGTGTSDIDNCVPSCAAASPNYVTATITLSDPVNGRFTQMTETRNGTTTSYTYPGTWAQSAS